MHISVIGTGSWGCALAQVWARSGHNVTLYGRSDDVIDGINHAFTHPSFTDAILHPSIRAEKIPDTFPDTDLFIYALPAQVMRTFLSDHTFSGQSPFMIVSKGIDISTGKLLSEIAKESEKIKGSIAILSGPNFAIEVIKGLPSASTIATENTQTADRLAQELSTSTFRLYHTDDMIGIQVGGALKNVIAIACGLSDGLNMGNNARAALITRGLAEMARMTSTFGGNRETLMGLSGMGDLILTCTSPQSRNYRYGISCAKNGIHVPTETVEGASTIKAIIPIIKNHHLDMPICEAIDAVLNGVIPLDKCMSFLMDRPLRGYENI